MLEKPDQAPASGVENDKLKYWKGYRVMPIWEGSSILPYSREGERWLIRNSVAHNAGKQVLYARHVPVIQVRHRYDN